MTSLYMNNQADPSNATRCQRSGITTRDVVEVGTSLLGGLGIGAALMYLFDPETGPERRTYLADSAAEHFGASRGAMGNTFSRLSDMAGSLTNRFSDGAETAADSASGYYDAARKRLSRGFSSARDTASDWRDYLPSMPTMSSLRSSMPTYEREHHSTAGLIASAAGCIAAGALLMFLMDPNAGRRRRAVARDKAYSTAKRSARYAGKTARHYRNVAKGTAHEIASAAQYRVQQVSDRAKGMMGQGQGAGEQSGATANATTTTVPNPT